MTVNATIKLVVVISTEQMGNYALKFSSRGNSRHYCRCFSFNTIQLIYYVTHHFCDGLRLTEVLNIGNYFASVLVI